MDKDAARRRLVAFARKHLGKPYRYGSKPHEAPKSFDCSSFVQYLYKKIDIELPRTTIQQAVLGKAIELKPDKLKIGDLIFIKGSWGRYNPEFPQGIGHVAMYAGNRVVIEAKWLKNRDGSDGGFVMETPLEAYLKRKDITVIKRILD